MANPARLPLARVYQGNPDSRIRERLIRWAILAEGLALAAVFAVEEWLNGDDADDTLPEVPGKHGNEMTSNGNGGAVPSGAAPSVPLNDNQKDAA